MRKLTLTCALIALVAAVVSAAAGSEFEAGVARVDLTPPLEIKASLGGYGDRMSKPAVGVHDRIFAKALVLSDGSKRFALVTADVLAFPPNFKPAVVEAVSQVGWTSDQIMLLPSHSHTSIDMTAINPKNVLGIPQIGIFNKELYELTVANLAKVVTDASKNLVAVSVGTSAIELHGWNRNRRGGNTTDSDLTITRIDKASGAPLAVLVNWTAHPTFMGSRDMMFSGGWPGHMQRTVEALIGRDVTAMYFNGAEGDQSPVPRKDSGGGNWERAERYGRELGVVVWREWQKIKPTPSPAFSYHYEEIALPKRTWHRDFMKTGGSEYGLDEQLVEKVIALMVPPKTVNGSLRLGDLLVVGVPGEMAAGLGKSIKSRVRRATGAKHTVIGGLANEWVSYILPADEYNKGGYEASVSFYGETLGQIVVESVVKGASQLTK